MARALALLLPVVVAASAVQAREPIIDMHLHARRPGPITDAPALCAPPSAMPRWDNSRPLESGLSEAGTCADPLPPAASGEAVMRETLAVMSRRNIIAMASGEPDDVARWRALAPERVIPGLDLRITTRPSSRFPARSPAEVRVLLESGSFRVLGEVMAQYEGLAPDDPRLEPYWALAEALEVPVGLHLGVPNPGAAYQGPYRVRDGSPLALEEVLVRHPRLRLYIMHAGYPLLDELLALLAAYPQVHVDVAAIVGTEPRAAFDHFLQRLVAAGFSDRVMFGTDQGVWPGLIERSIDAIAGASYLSAQQKRDILYNNAARFLRLSAEEIARHHAM